MRRNNARARSEAVTPMKPTLPTQPITIPDEALEALAVDGAVTLIATPPPGLPEARWHEWSRSAFEPNVSVADVLPVIENGERLARVAVGDVCRDDGGEPQVFRLPVPTNRVSIVLTPRPTPPGRVHRRRPTSWVATGEGTFPPSEPQPPPPNNRTKPIRVRESTADRLAQFASERKVTVASLIEYAVASVYH